MKDVDALLKVLDGTRAIVCVYDRDERLVYANQAYRDAFLPGHDGSDITFPDILRYGFARGVGVQIDSGDIESFLKDIMPRRRAVAERSIVTDLMDGRWLHITETLLPDGSMLSVGSDITALKRNEKSMHREHEKAMALTHDLRRRTDDLARSNSELEQFASVVSHDLQEPLRTVASYTQLLATKGQADPAAAAQYGSFIVSGVMRMQSLISDLLAYSRASTTQIIPAPVPLDEALDKALLNLGGTLKSRGASVTRDVLPTVMGHEPQLAQVLQNLVGNAVKFCNESPKVHVSAQRRGLHWAISVQDNGIGIEPQHLPKLFMIFQRLHARESYEGTGIGLAICKKIVERHGGRIWMESSGAGTGARACFTLPAAR